MKYKRQRKTKTNMARKQPSQFLVGQEVAQRATGEIGVVIEEWGSWHSCPICYAPVKGIRCACGHEGGFDRMLGAGVFDVRIGGRVRCISADMLTLPDESRILPFIPLETAI